jgi:hypothetical protein
MIDRLIAASGIIVIFILIVSCMGGPPGGSPETGYSIYGFVGESSVTAAPNRTVTLLNGDNGTPLANATTNLFGKYSFSHLAPGRYLIKTGEKTMEVYLIDKNIRLDIDLSSKDGVMNYAAGAAKENKTAPGKPEGDANLAQQIAGKYYSYSGGSTLGGGGGSESQIAFCPDGSYFESYESGYYSSGEWGSAAESKASGSWTIQGTIESGTITINYSNGRQSNIEYVASGEKGCYKFGGRLYCFNGACD